MVKTRRQSQQQGNNNDNNNTNNNNNDNDNSNNSNNDDNVNNNNNNNDDDGNNNESTNNNENEATSSNHDNENTNPIDNLNSLHLSDDESGQPSSTSQPHLNNRGNNVLPTNTDPNNPLSNIFGPTGIPPWQPLENITQHQRPRSLPPVLSTQQTQNLAPPQQVSSNIPNPPPTFSPIMDHILNHILRQPTEADPIRMFLKQNGIFELPDLMMLSTETIEKLMYTTTEGQHYLNFAQQRKLDIFNQFARQQFLDNGGPLSPPEWLSLIHI